MSRNAFEELLTLKDRAVEQADHISAQLAAGTPPDELVVRLQTQVEILSQLQARISDLKNAGWGGVSRREVQGLQQAFQHLVQASENHLRQVSKKGIRLPGLGGKPRLPVRKPKTGQ